MVKIKKAKDINGESFYFASHAQATFLDDGSTVQDQIEQIKEITDNYVSPDLSNCVTPQQLSNSLSSKQDVILDLDAIREGAIKGKAALQRKDLSAIAFSNNYSDLGNTPHIPTINDVEEWGFVNQDTVTELLNTKVDAIDGKVLSSNDFTDILKSKLENLVNYDDSAIQLSLETLQESFDTLVNGDTTTAIKSFNEIISFLDGIQDTQDLSSIIANIQQQITGKADKSSLSTVATSGSYNDLSNKPTIPAAVTESTVSGWGFTKNTGTYSKPSTGIPKSDLASAVQTSLGKADTALQSYTEQYTGTITGVSANGASVATSGVANIPAASTSAYGVTKLSSATNSTSTTLAATASAVKAAYDLANSYKGTVTGIKINGINKTPSGGVVDLGTVITAHQTLKTINGESIVGSGDITISGGSSDANVQAVDTGDVLDDVAVNYATITYVDNKVANIDLTSYATTSYVGELIGDINSVLESIINS